MHLLEINHRFDIRRITAREKSCIIVLSVQALECNGCRIGELELELCCMRRRQVEIRDTFPCDTFQRLCSMRLPFGRVVFMMQLQRRRRDSTRSGCGIGRSLSGGLVLSLATRSLGRLGFPYVGPFQRPLVITFEATSATRNTGRSLFVTFSMLSSARHTTYVPSATVSLDSINSCRGHGTNQNVISPQCSLAALDL
jgi:hypothetical protein